MNGNFEACLKPLLIHEGGNDDDPQDPGGRTSRGITQTEYDRYRQRNGLAKRDVWTATDAEVSSIYRIDYWNVLKCDDLPAGIDYCVFDYGVNSGTGRAAIELQKALGIHADADIGPQTIAAAKAADASKIIDEICDSRLEFLRGLSTWSRFGHGWSTRVQDVRDLSIEMADKGEPERKPQGLIDWLLELFKAFLNPWTKPQPKPKPIAEPSWLTLARKDIGFHETGNNQGLDKFLKLAKTGNNGDPWCAIFANAKLEESGTPGTRSAMARSFEKNANFVKLNGPALGAISTFWRGSPTSGSGHVNFYVGTDSEGRNLGLGGNQSDQVDIAVMDMSRHTGWWWPKSVALPKIGQVTETNIGIQAGKES